MKCVILAGGAGTRLWPASRELHPKQFMQIRPGKTLLTNTIERILMVNPNTADIAVSTGEDYTFLVRDELLAYKNENIITEPSRRNTAPAIALIVHYMEKILRAPKDEVIFISPADHFVDNPEEFIPFFEEAKRSAEAGNIVTFGIRPSLPETGYGYIEYNPSDISSVHSVKRFVEKPNATVAQSYLDAGNYLWNSGMFMFRIDTIKAEFAKYVPEIATAFALSYDDFLDQFDTLPEIAFDYAIMERTTKATVIPANIQWSDIGSWDSIYEVLPKDADGNSTQGDVMAKNTHNCLIRGDERLVVTDGIDDVLIIDTPDVLYIGKKGNSQGIKEVVGELKKQHRPEVERHTTVHRPWGSYTVLEEGIGYKIKRISVLPGKRLSLQRHYHRSEHWIVVKGTAQVLNGEQSIFLSENMSTYIPKTSKHRLENPGKETVELIEVQTGSYLEEDDIVRFDDDFGRV